MTDISAPFALARFRTDGPDQLGLVAGDGVRAISAADLGAADLNAFLADPDSDRLSAVASGDGDWMPVADVVFTAPVEPGQVLQTGANYRQHVIELVAAGLSPDPTQPRDEARDRAAKMMDERAAQGEPSFFIGLPWFTAHMVDEPWNRGRAVIIGDAAHSCPPTIAQGAAQGLEDALVLTELLIARDAVDQALWDAFHDRRLPRARAVVEASVQLGQWQLEGNRDADAPGLIFGIAHRMAEPA